MREPEDEQPKFLISDGIHRIQRAKELGISCILADVEECIHIKKKQNKKTRKQNNIGEHKCSIVNVYIKMQRQ